MLYTNFSSNGLITLFRIKKKYLCRRGGGAGLWEAECWPRVRIITPKSVISMNRERLAYLNERMNWVKERFTILLIANRVILQVIQLNACLSVCMRRGWERRGSARFRDWPAVEESELGVSILFINNLQKCYNLFINSDFFNEKVAFF